MIKEYKTINGELSIELQHNIITAKFSGALDAKLTLAFKRALLELTPSLNGQKWGYLSLSQQSLAATPEAEDILVECMQLCWSLGCVVAAYVLGSNLAVDQLDRVCRKAGLQTGAEGKVFDSPEQGKLHIEQTLSSF